jgi:PhnB protein
MPERPLYDRFDELVQRMFDRDVRMDVEADLLPLMQTARDLVELPREVFKARLKSDLERNTSMATTVEAPARIRQSATPRLRVKNAAAAIEFYKKAFDAREIMRFEVGGEVPHAELTIGNSVVTLGEEAPEYGFPGPEALGGSPVSIQLDVEDADAVAAQAVAAGARLVQPVMQQFYGDRSGTVADPFGYIWAVRTRQEEISVDEMHRRFDAMMQSQKEKQTAPSFMPKGFHAVTPYLIAQDVPALVDFVKQVFEGEETFRSVGSAGGYHCEARIGDSTLMIGGGGAGVSWKGESQSMALHVYVKDTDAVYRRAIAAGAVSQYAPQDHDYGERSGSVIDASGIRWYIATNTGEHHIPEGLHSVNAYLHPLRAEPVIGFLKRAFGGREVMKHASPDGVIHHARVQVGDSIVEMGEAHGPYQPLPSMFYLYVPDVDATYNRALVAGSASINRPADQDYGDRNAAVKDPFGNTWYIATQFKEVRG